MRQPFRSLWGAARKWPFRLLPLAVLALGLTACGPAVSSAQRASPPATLGAGVQSYQASAARISTTMGDSLDKVQSLMGNAQPSDPTWRSALSQQLLVWHQQYLQAQKLRPPAQLSAANATFVSAMANYDAAGKDIAAALNTSNATRFASAKQELQAANQGMQQAHQQLQAAAGLG